MTPTPPQVKNEGTLPAMLTWSMHDANIDAKEAAKKVNVSLQVSMGMSEGMGRGCSVGCGDCTIARGAAPSVHTVREESFHGTVDINSASYST